jgi:hypothetical protein
MPKSYTYIVASLHGRSGKTLLARLLADYAILQGDAPIIFDTDAAEQKLSSFFPTRSIVVDLDKVTDQMSLFDTLTVPTSSPRVVDLTHRSFPKFFNLMQEIGFVAEAKARDNEPVIFYIHDHEADSFAEGRRLREQFKDCHFVLTQNSYFGPPDRQIQRSDDYRMLKMHDLHLFMPTLDPMFVSVADDPHLSLSDFMHDPVVNRPMGELSLAYLSLEARASIQAWLKEIFAEVQRLYEIIKLRSDMTFKKPF